MAIYSNISGTTSTSFKIGANGVLLQSEAVSTGDFPGKYLLTNQTYDNRQLRVAFEFADEDPSFSKFDSFISSDNIAAINNTNNGLVITLKNNSTIKVISGPVSSTNNAVALFDGATGTTLKDSGKFISSEISNANADNIPTIGAVIGYVGTLSQALQQRLDGTL